MQDLGVDAVVTVKVGDVSHDPDLIAVWEYNFSCVLVGIAQIGLFLELLGVGYAWGQIVRQKDCERYCCGEKAGRDAGGVFGAGDRDNQTSVRGRGRIVGDGVDVNWIGWASPSLDLLCDFLGVWWGENAGESSVAKRVWEKVEQVRDGVRQTDRSENTRAQERVAAEGIE